MSTFTEAVEVLIIRRTQKVQPADPNAYATTMRKDLLYRLQDDAKAILAEEPDLDAKTLADRLDPGSNATTPTEATTEHHVGPPQPPTYEPEPWKPASADEVQRAKSKIAAIKRDVLGESA